ncbi:unnamed protein product [Polarella glacialis]|uniref:Uncharacterized protein n=1 Tax=Polarella glacialis TaxID=89957 RepID=A0A813F132_POLGL|nr:unnamed protein product [Polarella glacialis]CAE8735811.1 unnamed protein product [Polarella glacialis]
MRHSQHLNDHRSTRIINKAPYVRCVLEILMTSLTFAAVSKSGCISAVLIGCLAAAPAVMVASCWHCRGTVLLAAAESSQAKARKVRQRCFFLLLHSPRTTAKQP